MTAILRLLSASLLTAVILSFITGIGLSALLPLRPALLVPLTSATLIATLVLSLRRRTAAAHLALLSLFLLLGLLHGSTAARSPADPDHIFNPVRDKGEAVITATLTSMPTWDGRSGRATVELESIRMAGQPDFQAAAGRVLVRTMAPWPNIAVPGTMLALRLSLQRPSRFNTPGTFDYPEHLARQGIWVTGYLSSPAHLARIPTSTSLLHRLRFWPERVRQHIGAAIDVSTPAPFNGIYRALVIGDQSRVDAATRNLFRDAGVMHILAISGLHFAIIATMLFGLSFWLLRRSTWLILHTNVRKIALLACLPPLLLYAFLAGMNVPVLRALVMSGIAIAALCTDRRKSIATLVAAAALLILLLRPQALFTASFQLSFAAVVAIALAAPAVRRLTGGDRDQTSAPPPVLQRCRRWIAAALLISIAATLGTAPLLLYHFNHLSLIAPLTNLLVEPLICLWSLPFALLACLTLPVSPDLAAALLGIGTPGLTIALKVMELFTRLPHSSAWLPTPSLWLICAGYAALLPPVWSRWHKRAMLIAAVALAGIGFLFVVPPAELTKKFSKELTVSFLDVGQGSATLLEFPGGYRVLIDGGGSSSASRTVGETVIAPFLWHKGITRLDHLVVTHPDSDHYNGLPFILAHFSPAVFWTNDLTATDRPYARLLEQAREQGLEVRTPTEGERLVLGGGELRCITNLSAGPGERLATGGRRNDRGLVIQARLGGYALLFPGDIGRSIERGLLDSGDELAATLLLSPHHGSKTSNSQAFLSAVGPEYLVVSAGTRQPAHFPHPGLKRQCDDLGITMLTTGRDGTVVAATDGRRFSVATTRPPSSGKAGAGIDGTARAGTDEGAGSPP